MITKPTSTQPRKFVFIGGPGLVGKPLVARLHGFGHTVFDVSNLSKFDETEVLDFLTRWTNHTLAAAIRFCAAARASAA